MKAWFGKKTSQKATQGVVVIMLPMQKIAWVEQSKGEWLIKQVDSLGTDSSGLLASWVKSQHKEGADCIIVLDHHDVELFNMQLPNVPTAELNEALQWRLVDYLDYSTESAIWDYIELPSTRDKLDHWGYLVVMRRERMDAVTQWISDASLNPQVMDILPSALMEVLKQCPEQQKGQALLYLSAERSCIVIGKDSSLYMHRELDVSWSADQKWPDELIIEIQRSVDYCSTKFQNIHVVQYQLLTTYDCNKENVAWLQDELATPVNLVTDTEHCTETIIKSLVRLHYD